MEIEKKVTVAATPAQVWTLLLDAHAMAGCVPGMQSVDVISPTEYVGVIKVKISFISATFKLNTKIVEQREPEYMRIEGTGEDASVASSLKQQSEIFVAALPDGNTELRMLVRVDVLGRLGTFGLSVMKTKADRMWDEFCQNFAKQLGGDVPAVAAAAASASASASATPAASTAAAVAQAPVAPTPVAAPAPAAAAASPRAPLTGTVNGHEAHRAAVSDGGWWSRMIGGRASAGKRIHVELRRGDTLVKADWPAEAAADCASWLRDVLS